MQCDMRECASSASAASRLSSLEWDVLFMCEAVKTSTGLFPAMAGCGAAQGLPVSAHPARAGITVSSSSPGSAQVAAATPLFYAAATLCFQLAHGKE